MQNRLCNLFFMLILLLVFYTSTTSCANDEQQKAEVLVSVPSEKEKLGEIKRVFKERNLPLWKPIKLPPPEICTSFAASMLSDNEITAIEPDLRATSYDDKVFSDYHGKCSHLRLDEIEDDPESGTTAGGELKRDFKAYLLHGLGKANYLFYAEGFGGEEGLSKENDFAVGGYGGRYVLINAEECRRITEYNVPASFDYYSNKLANGSSLVVSYRDHEYLLVKDAYTMADENGRKLQYIIDLIDFENVKGEFHPSDEAVCVFER